MLPEYHIDHPPTLPLRPTRIELDPAALRHNLGLLGERCGLGVKGVMPVVKANAYGHGMLAAVRALIEGGARRLAVGFLEEGILLRREGVEVPILVMGGLVDYQIPSYLEYDLEMTVSSLHKARQVAQQVALMEREPGGKPLRARVQLKIDTGMERIGVHVESAPALIREALRLPHLHVCGVYSHLAGADSGPEEAILEPLGQLQALREEHGGDLPGDCLWHLANSAAAVRRPDCAMDLVRPGIMIYGVDPAGATGRSALLPGLRPALSWKSAVVYFKVVRAGRGISYGHAYRPGRDTRVVTVPVGYGDGYPRGMSGRAEVLVRGRRHPVVGAICMDQLMVDLGPTGSAYNGDEVVLVGEQGGQRILVEDLARWQSTIPYEILTGISDRVPRVLVDRFTCSDE